MFGTRWTTMRGPFRTMEAPVARAHPPCTGSAGPLTPSHESQRSKIFKVKDMKSDRNAQKKNNKNSIWSILGYILCLNLYVIIVSTTEGTVPPDPFIRLNDTLRQKLIMNKVTLLDRNKCVLCGHKKTWKIRFKRRNSHYK